MSLKEMLLTLPTYSKELGLELKKAEDRFKWFLASILFAKRISSEIAKRTYKQFEKEGITTPEQILEAGWDKLVEVLDSGGYVRYDFSTASKLLEVMKNLKQRYSSLENLYAQAKNSQDLEKKLLEFKGIGPITVNIFLRELKTVWEKANPPLSHLAREAALRLSLEEEELLVPHLESSLVRLNLEFCKRKRCLECPVKEVCREPKLVRTGKENYEA
jgi:endonuclease III